MTAPQHRMQLESPKFEDGQFLPSACLLEADNVSPPLRFVDVPAEARSLVLIIEDIDSPIGAFTHWVVWNLPPDIGEIAEGSLPPQAEIGINGYGAVRYDGPAPPSGRHRCRIRLVALDRMLEATSPDRKDHIEDEMESHVLCEAELTALCDADHPTVTK